MTQERARPPRHCPFVDTHTRSHACMYIVYGRPDHMGSGALAVQMALPSTLAVMAFAQAATCCVRAAPCWAVHSGMCSRCPPPAADWRRNLLNPLFGLLLASALCANARWLPVCLPPTRGLLRFVPLGLSLSFTAPVFVAGCTTAACTRSSGRAGPPNRLMLRELT